jgi:hypothetical protein
MGTSFFLSVGVLVLMIRFLCALFGYLYLRCKSLLCARWNGADQIVTDPAYNTDGQYTPYVPFPLTIYTSLTLSPLFLPCIRIRSHKKERMTNDNRVIILFAFLIGINEGLCLGSVIDAGVSTIFVGLGEDPM